MYSSLRGKISDIGEDMVCLDVHGVGFEVHMTSTTTSVLELGQELLIWIYTHVREDAISLFGFSSKTEKELFLSLNKVNGIGPKMALKVMSGARVTELVEMVEAGDVKALSQLPKVGKKTAEQIVLSLRGKLPRFPETVGRPSLVGARDEILSALVNLGFKEVAVQQVIQVLPPNISVEEGVRKALSSLSASRGN